MGGSESSKSTESAGRLPFRDPALLAASGPLARILDLADDAIISVDESQRIILFNHGAEKIFGYSAAELSGQPLDLLLPEALIKTHVFDFEAVDSVARRISERTEVRGRRKDSTEFPAEASISKVDVEGHKMYTVILRDVTERMIADERLKASLREKEALLKEIHHRVKNNLQVVSSLLGLQGRLVADPETRKMFLESQNRIHSMALLHESLYQSKHLSQIDFPEYIRQLSSYLFHSYGVRSNRIHLRTNVENLALHLDAAVPCGLIINAKARSGSNCARIRMGPRACSWPTTESACKPMWIG
jgi:PAS domain S-box-containing protein